MRPTIIADMLSNIEATNDSMIVMHVLPPIMHGHAGNKPTSRIMTARDLTAEDGGDVSNIIAITLAQPISPVTLHFAREQFRGWLEQADRMALDESGHGIRIGYDPLRPDRHAAFSDIGMTDECVFLWDRPRGDGPLFEWSDVAAMTANRDEESAMILLVDGRSVFLHADVDWDNRLS